MGHYTGPKARINRALGAQIYESSGAVRAAQRHEAPPGQHARRAPKQSTYGLALREKKKLKHYYGLGEKQLCRFLEIAQHRFSDTGEGLMTLCERRLDNVVRRAGFTRTRPQARQGVAHGHFRVNGVPVDRPSFLVLPGDVITVRDRVKLRDHYRAILEESPTTPTAWINIDRETLTATIATAPSAQDVSLPLEVHRIIEAYR